MPLIQNDRLTVRKTCDDPSPTVVMTVLSGEAILIPRAAPRAQPRYPGVRYAKIASRMVIHLPDHLVIVLINNYCVFINYPV